MLVLLLCSQDIEEAHRAGLLRRPVDLVFIIYLIPALAFCVFRGLVRNLMVIGLPSTHTTLDYFLSVGCLSHIKLLCYVFEVVLDCSSKWCQDYTQQYEPYLKDPSAYPKVQVTR